MARGVTGLLLQLSTAATTTITATTTTTTTTTDTTSTIFTTTRTTTILSNCGYATATQEQLQSLRLLTSTILRVFHFSRIGAMKQSAWMLTGPQMSWQGQRCNV